MKKIFLYLCFFYVFGCVGYKPIFSTQNLSFYIKEIQNIRGDDVSKEISSKLDNYKIKNESKKDYILKISSNLSNNISSKDSKGVALTYEIIVNVDVEVFYGNLNLTPKILNFKESFIYKNQTYKIKLNQYRKDVRENLINKLSQDIIIKLQSF